MQLLLGTDYTFSTTDDSINITKTLAEGDKIKIKDYPDTTGSYIPTTPTKLGIQADLDQFEEPTADPEAPAPEPGQPGQPGQTPGTGGQTPGGGTPT